MFMNATSEVKKEFNFSATNVILLVVGVIIVIAGFATFSNPFTSVIALSSTPFLLGIIALILAGFGFFRNVPKLPGWVWVVAVIVLLFLIMKKK